MRKLLISLPEETIILIDEAAKDLHVSRTECIRRILKDSLSEYFYAVEEEKRKDPFDVRFLDLDDS